MNDNKEKKEKRRDHDDGDGMMMMMIMMMMVMMMMMRREKQQVEGMSVEVSGEPIQTPLYMPHLTPTLWQCTLPRNSVVVIIVVVSISINTIITHFFRGVRDRRGQLA